MQEESTVDEELGIIGGPMALIMKCQRRRTLIEPEPVSGIKGMILGLGMQ
jgi:hypothetical protein